MTTGSQFYISENVKVSVDWISFTSFFLESVEEVVAFLGCTMEDFTSMPKGGNGYRKMLKLNSHPLYVLYDGNSDMGIHVSVSGSAISECINNFKRTLKSYTPWGDAYEKSDFENTYLIEFLTRIRRIGQISRIDLAVDDLGCNYYTTMDLLHILQERRCVSKFRIYKNLEERSMNGDLLGHTIYLGSRKSDIMLRVYDKKLEQNKKLESKNEPLLEEEWCRWELECKDARANRVVDFLIQNKNIGSIVSGILGNYFREILLDDNNKSRCTTCSRWISFIGTIERIGLYISSDKKTLKDKRAWVIRQVLPTLTGIIIADGGAFDIITNHIETSINRMSTEMREILTEQNPEWIAMCS